MLDTDSQQLISSIYAATLSPQGFDDMAREMEDRLIQIITDMAGSADIADSLSAGERSVLGAPELAALVRHIDTARRIQAQIHHPDAERDMEARLQAMLDLVPSPALVFDRDERIVRANAAAAPLARGRDGRLSAIFAADTALGDIRRAVTAISEQDPVTTLPIDRDAARDTGNCAIVRRITVPKQAGTPEPLFMLSMADCTFDDSVRAQFKSAYRLTDAETEVAILLAAGARADEVAGLRDVSPSTVRAQIRAIKAKTRVRHLPDLVRLLCGLAVGMAVQRPQGPSTEAAPSGRPLQTFHLPDGRRLDWVVQGDPDGAPVLLFHNLPYGVTLPAAADRYARRHGLRVIAPYRPGHGYSDPLPDLHGMAYFDQVADDIAALCAHLSIGPARLFGCGCGSNFAVRFATRHPARATGIVMLGHAPMWYPERYPLLPQRYRVHWLLNKYMPELAAVFTNALMPNIGPRDYARFAKQFCDHSPPDLEALDNRETVTLLYDDTRFGMRQGPETHGRECLIMELDMSADARALTQPLHLIHGAQDRVLRPDFSREFARVVPKTQLDIVPDAGNHIFYSHWRRAMDALLACGAG